MSVRAKFLGMVDVLMRIPPLFLLDEILKMNLNDYPPPPPPSNLVILAVEQLNETISNNLTNGVDSAVTSSIDFYALSITLLRCLVFLIGNSLKKKKDHTQLQTHTKKKA
jgi:hypothetical protein